MAAGTSYRIGVVGDRLLFVFETGPAPVDMIYPRVRLGDLPEGSDARALLLADRPLDTIGSLGELPSPAAPFRIGRGDRLVVAIHEQLSCRSRESFLGRKVSVRLDYGSGKELHSLLIDPVPAVDQQLLAAELAQACG